MKTKNYFRHLPFAMVLLLLAIGFEAFPQKVDCFVINAPTKQFYNIKKIGVMEFSGNKEAGQMLADLMIANLLREDRGIVDLQSGFMGLGKKTEGVTYVKGFKTNVYTVIERNQIDQIMKEQRLGLSGAIDESTAAKVGAILGLDAIIIGNVNFEKKEDNTSNSYKGLDGKSYTKNCKIRSVSSTASMKLIEVSTAEIIGVETADVRSEDKQCNDDRPKILSYNQLLNNSLNEISTKFVNYFTPGFGLVRFDLEKIKVKDLKRQAGEASDYLESGNLERAFPLFQAIYEADSYNPKAAYNLGVVNEMVGSYDQAIEYYGIASQLDPTNSTFDEALKRAKAGKLAVEFLESIGKPIEKFGFASSGGDVLAEKITLKGKSSDRVDVREYPDKGAGCIAKVPGGLQFNVLEKQGEWYRIKLLNNKEGFVHRSDVD